MSGSIGAPIAYNPFQVAGQAVDLAGGVTRLRTQQFELQQAKQAQAYSMLMPLLGKQNVSYDDINAALGASARLGGDPSGVIQNATEAMGRGMTPGDFVRQYSQMALPASGQWEAAYTQGGFTPQQLWQDYAFWDGRQTQHIPLWKAMGMMPPGAAYGGFGPGQQALPPAGGGAAGGVGFATRQGPRPTLTPPQGVTPDEDAMVRTVIGEAADQPLAGQQGVAHVIMNRATAAKASPSDVVFASGQFEPWGNPATAQRLAGLDPASPQYQSILNNVVRPVEAGNVADNTGGATHFFAPDLQQQLGRNVPGWATPDAHTVTIGGHSFYRPSGGYQIASAGPNFPVPVGLSAGGPQLPPAFGWTAPPPGYEETIRPQIGRQQAMESQMNSSINARAILQGMETELSNMPTSGIAAGPLATLKNAIVSSGIANQQTVDEQSKGLAAQEQFDKFSSLLNQQLLQGMGGQATDARQELTGAATPSSIHSKLGNLGIIHMLEGNISALQVMGRMFRRDMNAGQATPQQFDSWRDNFTAPTPDGARFDPRVFWIANMGPQEQQAYINGLAPKDKAQLLKNANFAEQQRWVYKNPDNTMGTGF